MTFFKSLKLILLAGLLSNCAVSNYKLQKESPLKFHKIEVQKWAVNNQNRDSGIKMYLILPSDIKATMDSVYYNNLKTNVYKGKNKNAYFANFRVDSKTKQNRKNQFPFVLKNNECVVSYKESGKIKYYKYSGVKEKS